MNDDLHPSDVPSDDLLAVNAVIDGSPTAADEATVQASSDLQALVEEMRTTARELRSVHVSAVARETALGAALALFDELHAHGGPSSDEGPSAPVADVVVLQRRRTQYRWLAGAAAAVAVVFAGTVMLRGGSDGNDAAIVASGAEAKSAPLTLGSDNLDDTSGGEAPMSAMSPTETTAAAAIGTMAPSADALEVAATIGDISGAGNAGSVPIIAEPSALVAYATGREALPAPTGGPFPCVTDDSVVLGEVVYGVRAAIVTRGSDGTVAAIALDDCSVLLAVAP